MGEQPNVDGPGPVRRSWPRLLAGIAVWTVWALAVAWWWLHFLVLVTFGCPPYYSEDSTYGDMGWQSFPPGMTCTYYAEPGVVGEPVVVVQPDLGFVMVTLLLIAIPVASWAWTRPVRVGSPAAPPLESGSDREPS